MKRIQLLSLMGAATLLVACGGSGDDGAQKVSTDNKTEQPVFVAKAQSDDGEWTNVWRRDQQAKGSNVSLKIALGYGNLSVSMNTPTDGLLQCSYFFKYLDRLADEVYLDAERARGNCPTQLGSGPINRFEAMAGS